MAASRLSVATTVNVPVERAWACWTMPEHITQWNHASADWYTPRAENDLRVGGRFVFRMEARDGSVGFDFAGDYEAVAPLQRLVYRLADDRRVEVTFEAGEGGTRVVETFDPDTTHPAEMQQAGWQAILDNFKRYAEGTAG